MVAEINWKHKVTPDWGDLMGIEYKGYFTKCSPDKYIFAKNLNTHVWEEADSIQTIWIWRHHVAQKILDKLGSHNVLLP